MMLVSSDIVLKVMIVCHGDYCIFIFCLMLDWLGWFILLWD